MNQNKKGSTNSLTCNVCKVDFSSDAEYALHEFRKKHCDNLIRLARQKPVVNKQKNKNRSFDIKKESPKINTLTQTGSFAKYGYFVPGEIYADAKTANEFNTDYDPYLQKFAENPFKEKPIIPTPPETTVFCSVTSFSKKKNKKIKRCQICNVTMSTIPEYEAHMKSPQHMWKLKITGIGVSAHFVKASTNLHTIDINGECKSSNQTSDEQTPVSTAISNKNLLSEPFSVLYCNDCNLLLNSLQQYNKHIYGKFHIDCIQKKAELKKKKEKLENPSPSQLYCHSCKISLNNLFQYNEHKNGKKHKTKCQNLIKRGITIPPEERVPGIPISNPKKPVVYPESYEKIILEKQKQELKFARFSEINTPTDFTIILNHTENSLDIEGISGCSKDKEINSNYPEKSVNNLEIQNENKATLRTMENHISSCKIPEVMFHKNNSNSLINASTIYNTDIMSKVSNSEMNSGNDSVTLGVTEPKNEIRIILDNKPMKCSICYESFQSQSQLDVHLGTEVHLNKILELKMKGSSESKILSAIFSDRNVVKPSTMGKFTCSVCTVITDSKIEFYQHLNSIVHKYTLRDYRMKRTLEVKHMVSINEQGLYFCRLCKEGWPSLLQYTQHLHSLKHKTAQKAQRAKVVLARRRTSHLQKQRLKSLKKNYVSLRNIKTKKNPGIRTKDCGAAVDLQSGIQTPIPNLESLKPKIDLSKNLSLETCEKGSYNNAPRNNNDDNNNNDNNHNHKLTETEIKKIERSNRKFQNRGLNQINSIFYPNNIPLFMPSRNLIPPLLPCSLYQSRFSRSSYGPTCRNWVPYSDLYSPVFEPFVGRSAGHSYVRPPRFQKPSWPRYR